MMMPLASWGWGRPRPAAPPLFAVLLLIFQMEAAVTTASSVQTSPSDDPPDGGMDSALELAVSDASAALNLEVVVVPLTSGMGLGQSQQSPSTVNIEANITATNATNVGSIDNSTIAYVSCDPSDSDPPDAIINTLMDAVVKPRAIILYSQQRNYCQLQGDYTYDSVLTMSDAGDTASVSAFLLSGNQTSTFRATVTGNTSDSDGNNGDRGGRSNIAMSILYSATALVTILFLLVIATGAVRAHRHPERYGPRNAQHGQPRRSRARGLALAVLETIPIVKFNRSAREGDLEHKLASVRRVDTGNAVGDADDAASLRHGRLDRRESQDLEAGQPTAATEVPEQEAAGAAAAAAAAAAATKVPGAAAAPTAPPEAEGDAVPQKSAQGDDAQPTAQPTTQLPPAVPTRQQNSQEDDAPSCSICTEDFIDGEDVRLLPCSHQFHPNCIDPWLVNVSGTCPLCRLDLRHHGRITSEEPSSPTTGLPPPLDDPSSDHDAHGGTNDPPSPPSPAHAHLRTRLSTLLSLGHAPPHERLHALRQIITEARARPAPPQAQAPEDASRRARLAASLRDRFRIHTHAHTGGGGGQQRT